MLRIQNVCASMWEIHKVWERESRNGKTLHKVVCMWFKRGYGGVWKREKIERTKEEMKWLQSFEGKMNSVSNSSLFMESSESNLLQFLMNETNPTFHNITWTNRFCQNRYLGHFAHAFSSAFCSITKYLRRKTRSQS